MHFFTKSAAAALALAAFTPSHAAEVLPDPKVLDFKIPAKIPWGPVTPGGSQVALLYGDPAKPGLYVLLNKWLPGHMSKPHFHENDRFVTVLSGTWWVGTGDTWDPNLTTPMPAGSFVRHFAKQMHWDGAKDQETVLEIVGMGPAASIPSPTAKLPAK
ncbi:MAG: cupin domain-containing protein [Rhodospirillaceae bacterium]